MQKFNFPSGTYVTATGTLFDSLGRPVSSPDGVLGPLSGSYSAASGVQVVMVEGPPSDKIIKDAALGQLIRATVGKEQTYIAAFDGVAGDGVPCGKKLQLAIDNAIRGGYRDLILPAGNVNISDQGVEIWGGINTFLAGQITLFGLRVFGEGSLATTINIGNNVGLWWHTSENLVDTTASVQPNFMREFGGGRFTIVGNGINSGAVGIRVGGKRVNKSDVMENKQFEDVVIDQVTSCWQDDDSTNTYLRNFSIGVFKYGFEHGYNCDGFYWESGYYGHEDAFLWDNVMTGVTGAGISTFTVPDVLAPDGKRTSEKIGPGWCVVAPTVFPAGTYIRTLTTNGTTCTITTCNYAGSAGSAPSLKAGAEVSFFVGRVHVYGTDAYTQNAGPYPRDSSPWLPPYWGQGNENGSRGRLNGNLLRHGAVVGGRVELFLDAGGGSHFTLSVADVYQERCAGFVKLGRQGGIEMPQNTIIENVYPGVPGYFTRPWVDVLGSNLSGLVRVANCHLDSGTGNPVATQYPWVSIPTYGSWRLVWENNYLPVFSGGTVSQVRAFDADIGSPTKQLDSGDVIYSASPRRGTARQRITGQTTVNFNFVCQDVLDISLSGATTVNNSGYNPNNMEGKALKLVLRQDATGSRNVTLGSQFVNTSGTAIGTITGGAANTVASIEFEFINNFFVQRSPAVVWK